MRPFQPPGRHFFCLLALGIGIVITWLSLTAPEKASLPSQVVTSEETKSAPTPSAVIGSDIKHSGPIKEVAASPITAVWIAPTHPNQKRLLEGAALLSQHTEKADAFGNQKEVRLWRTGFKYPLIREEVRVVSKSDRSSARQRVYSVADHALVRFPDDVTEGMIHEWAEQNQFYVRHSLQTTRAKLIAVKEVSLDAVQKIQEAFQKEFPAQPDVHIAEPDYLVFPTLVPDDTNFESLWGLHNLGQSGGTADADIDAPEAWEITTGSRDVLVGVLDSGVDRLHPDLAANMWTNPGEIPGNGIDDDNNGFVDDVHGWDFFSNDNDSSDTDGHGTHCAGTIGAVGNNRAGVAGVCWEVSMVGIRFLGPDGGTTSDAMESIYYATSLGVHVTNNSWGGGDASSFLKAAIDDAAAKQILFVAAAGNDGTDNDVIPHYPSNYMGDNIISVASSSERDTRSSFSNYGKTSVDIAAPGSSIFSTVPGSSYTLLSGTSMAAPHVTGAIALAKSIRPFMDAADLKSKIMQTADAVPALNAISVSGKRLNAARLIEELAGPYPLLTVSSVTESTGSNGDGISNPGETLSIDFSVTNRGTYAATDVIATISSPLGTASRFNILEGNISIGNLAPSQSETKRRTFSVSAQSNTTTPYAEEMVITLYYGSPVQVQVQRFNLRLYSSSVVSGRVTDAADGTPLVGASVLLEGPSQLSVTTNESGHYEATLTDGVYQVSAGSSSFLRSSQVTVTTPPGRSNLDFSLVRPQLRLNPESVVAEAFRGSLVQREIQLANHGTAELEWNLRAQVLLEPTLYSLKAGAIKGTPPDVSDGISATFTREVSTSALPLSNLSGVRVGVITAVLDRSVLLEDLRVRGAIIVPLTLPLNEASLNSVNSVIVDDLLAEFSTTDMQRLRSAIQNGKGLLCEADNASTVAKAQTLLAGTGLEPVSGSFRDLTLTDILPHSMTQGVTLLREVAVGWTYTLSGAAQALVREPNGRVHAAISKLGQGVVVVVGNEITDASNFVTGDGRRFANQIMDGLVSGPEWLSLNPLSGTLQPGAQQKVMLTLDARTAAGGLHEGGVVVASNIPDEPSVILPVSFTINEAPRLVIESDVLDFGEVIERASLTKSIVIRNEGTAELILESATFSGKGAAAFKVRQWTEKTLPAGAEKILEITFLPDAPRGKHDAILSLTTNDPERVVTTVPVTGTRVHAPKAILTAKNIELKLAQGQTATRFLTLRNSGKGNLHARFELFFPNTGPTHWAVVESPAEVTLAPGKSAKITVRFNAGTHTAGNYVAHLRVISDDPDFDVMSRSLVLTTTAAPVPEFQGLTFEKTYVGEARTLNLTLANRGQAAMLLRTIRGANVAFGSNIRLPQTIPAGGSLTLPVIFSPKKAGEIQSSLLISSNVPGPAFKVPLTGLAARHPAVRLTPAKVVLNTAPGIPLLRSLKISNTGGEDLEWSAQVTPETAWLQVPHTFAPVNPGKKGDLILHFSTAQMETGSYTSSVKISTNDPAKPELIVPVSIKVSNQSVLAASPAALDLDEIWQGQEREVLFELSNVGNQPLEIRSVTSNSKELVPQWNGLVSLSPGQTHLLRGTFKSSKLQTLKSALTVKTNSRTTPTLRLPVNGKVVVPPMIKVTPEALAKSLLPTEVENGNLTVSNAGQADLNWKAEIVTDVSVEDGIVPLESVLARLNLQYEGLTEWMPNKNDFAEGVEGHGINDGGDGLYELGNIFSTDLSVESVIPYSENVIGIDEGVGSTGRYFTRKFSGLFVWAGDLNGAAWLQINGGLGTDSSAKVSGAILRRQGYVGFWKSVSSSIKASVNHLILMPEHEGLSHNFPEDASLDDHEITGLPLHTRAYALVFSTQAGSEMNQQQVMHLMDHFLLNVVHDAENHWLQVMTGEGKTAGGKTEPLLVRLDARGRSAGVYSATVRVSSNAPDTPNVDVPINLTVPVAPLIEMIPALLNMPDTPLRGLSSADVRIYNRGNAPLVIDGVDSSNPAFSVGSSSLPITLAVGGEYVLKVHFRPLEAELYSENLIIVSNAMGENQAQISLTGRGVPAPLLDVDTEEIVLTTRPGVNISHPITLRNIGSAPLIWNITNNLTTGTLSELSGQIPAGGTKVITLTTLSTATTPPGGQMQSISLYSNDPVRPVIGLPYTRNILAEPTLQVIPSLVQFGTVILPGNESREIVLRNVGNANLVIYDVVSPSAKLTMPAVTYPIIITPNNAYNITLNYASTTPDVLAGGLKFVTNNPINPDVSIPVSGVAAFPPTMLVQPGVVEVTVDEGQLFNTVLEVRNNGGSQLTWTSRFEIENSAPWVSIGYYNGSTAVGGVSYLPLAFSTAGLTPGDYTTNLVISSNAVENGTVTIPVTLHVNPSELRVSTSSIQSATVKGVSETSSFSLLTRPGESPAWTLSSTVPWITASDTSGSGAADIILTFASTRNEGTYTGDVTVSTATITRVIQVTRHVLKRQYNILKTDRYHDRLLGLIKGSSGRPSALVSIHPGNLVAQRILTLPTDITDVDLTTDERTLYAISYAGRSISRVSLDDFKLVTTKGIPGSTSYGTFYQVQAGRDETVYYTDASANPALHVYDFATGNAVSTFRLNGAMGIGGFVVSPNGRSIYARSQTGWGNTGTAFVTELNCSQPTLIPVSSTSATLAQDASAHPILLSANLDTLVTQGDFFSLENLSGGQQGKLTQAKIYNASAYLDVLVTDSQIVSGDGGAVIQNLPVSTTVTAFAPDQSQLIYQHPTLDTLGVVDTSYLPSILITPSVENASTQSPTLDALRWSGDPQASNYDVYFGTDAAAVENAIYGPAAPFTISTPLTYYKLPAQSLVMGQTYYWRVDARGLDGVMVRGQVWRFTVASVSTNPEQISGSGMPSNIEPQNVSLSITTAIPGASWTLSSGAEWAVPSQSAGTGSATITVELHPSQLPAGPSETSLTLSSGGSVVNIPVRFDVMGALNVVKMEADAQLPVVYALHRETVAPYRSWLLWVNPATGAILQGEMVGDSALDFASHPVDNRIYVLVENGRRMQMMDRPVGGNLLNSYALKSPQRAVHAGAASRLITLSSANALQLREATNGIEIGAAVSLLGRQSLTVASRAGNAVYAAVTQSSSNVGLVRYSVTTSGVNFVTANYFPGTLESPLLLSADGSCLIYGHEAYLPTNLNSRGDLGAKMHAVSPDGNVAASSSMLYELGFPSTALSGLPLYSSKMVITADGQKLLLFSSLTKDFVSVPVP